MFSAVKIAFRQSILLGVFSQSSHGGINITLCRDVGQIVTGQNSGVDPSTMKMKQWYPGQDRVSEKSPWQLPSDRVSDQTAPTGTDRACYQIREPIEDDERLATRRGDLPPPVLERIANPRIREDRAVQDFQYNSEKMHRAAREDAYTRAWFDYCRSVFPQSVRKAGPNVDLHNVSTYQCSILFKNMGSFNRKSEFRKVENKDKPISSNKKINVANDPQLSLLKELWGKQLRASDLDGRG